MRIFNIFLLHFQYVFERRAVSFVWFLISLFNPLLLLIYWNSALKTNTINGWNLSSISAYYFLLIIAGSMLMSHIEEEVAYDHIELGNLVSYLLQPFSYFWICFIKEIPYRLLQGSFGIVICVVFVLLFGQFFHVSNRIEIIIVAILSAALAYILSYTFKMIMGLSAFWMTDSRGFFQFIEVIILLTAGYILPLDLMPEGFGRAAALLPFPYMIYYPVVILQGKLSLVQSIQTIGIQIIWVTLFIFIYSITWKKGVKRFTGMGQ
jgi:ABC-2 type transport system permease protein